VAVIGLLTLLRMLVLPLLAKIDARRPRPFDPTFTPPVSIVVPAYEEEVTIARTVKSLAASDYPDVEILVVDDGSTDRTANVVEELGLPNVRVLRRPNGGKAQALNAGISATSHDIVVTVDADTLLEPGAVSRLVQPFADARVGAVSGNTKVVNRRGLLGRWQHIEYVIGFNLDRRAYDLLGFMPTVPGAIGAFRRGALTGIGGLSVATIAEDTDVTVAVARAGWRVGYAPDAIAWTEVPSTLGGLWRQRSRWAFGTLQSVWKHKRALAGRDGARGGALAVFAVVLFQILLPLGAPLIDLFALFGVIFLDAMPILVFWLAFTALQFLLALYAFHLDRESPRPLWSLPAQQVVYRQVMYLVVIDAVVSALRGVARPWRHVERTGEVSVGVE
jgi:cellulose synthase/poly-beta-1,6-N-acetylglucosamine synthase-like glycosyltransferase